MQSHEKLRYATAVFYSVLAFLFNSVELATVILPFLVWSEKKIDIKLRLFLTVSTFLILSFLTISFMNIYYTIFRLYIMTVFFLVLTLFDDAQRRKYSSWIAPVSLIILEFVLITYILSITIRGVMW